MIGLVGVTGESEEEEVEEVSQDILETEGLEDESSQEVDWNTGTRASQEPVRNRV